MICIMSAGNVQRVYMAEKFDRCGTWFFFSFDLDANKCRIKYKFVTIICLLCTIWLFNLFCSTRVWPLSLLVLRQVIQYLQLDRNHQNNNSILRCSRTKKSEHDGDEIFILDNKNKKLQDIHNVSNKHNNLLLKHIKMKKRHEIQQITQVCFNKPFWSIAFWSLDKTKK